MSENSYLDLLDEILRAMGERRHEVPRRKKNWRQVRHVIDGQGNVVSRIHTSRSKMISLKSPVTGQRLYRVKGAGWLLETQKPGPHRVGAVTALDDDQARVWMEANGWTVLRQEASAQPLDYTPEKGERIYVEGGRVNLKTEDAPKVDVVAENAVVAVTGYLIRFRGGKDAATEHDYGTVDPADAAVEHAGIEPAETNTVEMGEARVEADPAQNGALEEIVVQEDVTITSMT